MIRLNQGKVGSSMVFAARAIALLLAAGMAHTALARQTMVVRTNPDGDPPAIITRSSDNTVLVMNDGGKKVEVRMTDGAVTSVTIDGKSVGKNRVQRDGDTLRVVDDKGDTVAEFNVPRAKTRAFLSPRGDKTFLVDPGALDFGEDMPRPDVMVGLKMGPVSGQLAKHLGIESGDGVLVQGVAQGLPAAAAGLKPYDIVVAINGEPVKNAGTIVKHLGEKKVKPGDAVKFTVYQNGQRKEISVNAVKTDTDAMDKAEWTMIDEADAQTGMFTPMTPVPGVPGVPGGMGRAPMSPRELGDLFVEPQQFGQFDKQIQEETRRAVEKALSRMREKPLGTPHSVQPNTDAAMKKMTEALERMEKQIKEMEEQLKKEQKKQ